MPYCAPSPRLAVFAMPGNVTRPVAAHAASPAGNWDSGKERDTLLKVAHTVLGNCGIEMRPAKVRRLVQTFQHRVERNGFAFFDFLANSVALSAEERRRALADPDLQRVISWADPTGETAVSNVLRERGGPRAS